MDRAEHYQQINDSFKEGLKEEAKKHPFATALLALSIAVFGIAGVLPDTASSRSEILDTPQRAEDVDCITSTGITIPEGMTIRTDTCVDAYSIGDMRVSSMIYNGQQVCIESINGKQNVRTYGSFCTGSAPTPDVSE